MPGNPLRRSHQHPPVFRRDGERNKRGIVVVTVAKSNIDRIFKHIGPMVGKENAQLQRRVPLAKGAEDVQQQITPQIGGYRNLQRPADLVVRHLNFLQPGMQRIQHLGGIGQPGFPFGRQT